VEAPLADIEGCRRAHVRLAGLIEGLTDDVAHGPSALPAWTVGHVLTHLARNAESMCRRMDASMRGQVIAQYEGGFEGRAAQIEPGARRPADQLVHDAVSWSEMVDRAFGELPKEHWARPVVTVGGGEHPVSALPFRRWREVEVHLVDLGIGFTPADWSEGLVERALPTLLSALPARTDRRSLMAWTLGRAPAPDLEPWG
jgi:maleylpyruvate isomerase